MAQQTRQNRGGNDPDQRNSRGDSIKKKKTSPKAPLLAQFVAIIALSISIFLIIDLGRRAAANYRVQREAERLGQEVEWARQEQQRLLARRSYVASDLFIEEVARRDLKWARPGETVVVVMANPETSKSEPDLEAQAKAVGPVAQTPVQAWWLLFFDSPPPDYIIEFP